MHASDPLNINTELILHSVAVTAFMLGKGFLKIWSVELVLEDLCKTWFRYGLWNWC